MIRKSTRYIYYLIRYILQSLFNYIGNSPQIMSFVSSSHVNNILQQKLFHLLSQRHSPTRQKLYPLFHLPSQQHSPTSIISSSYVNTVLQQKLYSLFHLPTSIPFSIFFKAGFNSFCQSRDERCQWVRLIITFVSLASCIKACSLDPLLISVQCLLKTGLRTNKT